MPEPPGTLAEALIRLQASLPRITKDDEAQVGTRTYRYANLASIYDTAMPLLADLGLLWRTKPTLRDDGQFVLTYLLTHVPSGESDGGDFPLTIGAPQAQGSAISYAKRYAFNAMLNLAPVEDDDDGKAAQASYEERVAAGRMNREQMREHGQLERDVKSSPRRAERISGPAADDSWTGAPPPETEDYPGGSLDAQHQAIGRLFTRLRITDRGDRLKSIAQMMDLPGLESMKDLSYTQAGDLLRKLQKMISEEGKP